MLNKQTNPVSPAAQSFPFALQSRLLLLKFHSLQSTRLIRNPLQSFPRFQRHIPGIYTGIWVCLPFLIMTLSFKILSTPQCRASTFWNVSGALSPGMSHRVGYSGRVQLGVQQTRFPFSPNTAGSHFPASLVVLLGHVTRFWPLERRQSDMYDTSRWGRLGADVPVTYLLSSLIYWLETEDLVEGSITLDGTAIR